MRTIHLINLAAIYMLYTLFLSPVAMAATGILAVEVLSEDVQTYSLFEIRVSLDAPFSNPYDRDDIEVVTEFTAPDGTQYKVAGFWYIPYFRSTGTTGVAVPLRQPGEFRVRFTPTQPGEWVYSVQLFIGGQPVDTTAPVRFMVKEGDSNGFIRIGESSRRGFQYDDGTPFFGIGVNLAWWDKNPGDYDRWIPMLAENGVNLIRLWMSPWSFAIEWKQGPLGNYDHRQEQATQLDHVLDLAQRHGIQVLLVLINHGQFSLNVDAQWTDNPYNVANGGFLNQPHDFFTDARAIELFQQRLRYIVSRWGHHTSILAWELWNEVNLTAGFESEPVASWHKTMSDFLRDIDPYDHLISTSFSNSQLDPHVWRLPNIDFTMTHFYNVSDMATALLSLDRTKTETYNKPSFSAEFGVSLDNARLDPDGVFFHNGLWAGIFSSGAATPMSWWWDNYLEPNGLFSYFSRLSNFLQNTVSPTVLAEPVDVRSSDSGQGNVLISTTLGWGGKPQETDITLHADGTMTIPLETASYMMGAVYNTYLRSEPLRFHLEGDSPTAFGVLVEDVSTSGATLRIRIDGNDALTESFDRGSITTQTLVEVEVPPGAKTIEVDNIGLDWLRITGYQLSGLANQSRVFGVQGEGDIVLWIQDRNHTYAGIVAGYTPSPIEDGKLIFNDIVAGTYEVMWWDTWKGVLVKTEVVRLEPGDTLSIPPFTRDISVRLRFVEQSS